MSCRCGLLFSAPLVLLALGGCTKPGPNLILISLDDLRVDRLGCYGYQRPTSPFIDALAEKSTVFADVVTQFTSTRYSHLALLTGQYPFSSRQEPLLAQVLRKEGFRTAGFTGGGFMHHQYGFDRGFEVFSDSQQYKGLQVSLPQILPWLREHYKERFFLLVHTYDAHCPWAPPEPYRSMFVGEKARRFEIDGKCDNNYYNAFGMTPEDYDVLSDVYDGNVRWTDALVGQLLQEIARLGLDENTVIVVIADHGEVLGTEGVMGHGKLYEEEVHVPLIMYVPHEAAQRVLEPAQLIDVMPTVLHLLNVDAPPALDGVDLVPYMRGKLSFGGKRLRITQAVEGERAIRANATWKLVVGKRSAPDRLFNIQRNPLQDVSRDNPAITRLLHHQLDRALSGAKDLVNRPLATETLAPELRVQLKSLGYLE